MSEYKPGTVAVATVRGKKDRQVVRCRAVGWSAWFMPNYSDDEHGNGWWPDDDEVTDVRPLVVLDLEDVAGVLATLRDAKSLMLTGGPNRLRLADLIAEIEAQTRPPKPDEPQGLGAVVEDRSGVQWVRVPKDGNEALTEWISYHSTCHTWDVIDAVRVLSEGVAQ